MPREIVSQHQAGLAGLIAAGKVKPNRMGFASKDEAKDVLRGTKVKQLPERKAKKSR